MNYKPFGDTGIEVSEVGFGAWGIGGTPMDARAYGPTDDKVSRSALKRAFEKGVTFYDTSPLYGYGHSEELIGTTLKDVRQDIIISSKLNCSIAIKLSSGDFVEMPIIRIFPSCFRDSKVSIIRGSSCKRDILGS